MSGKRIYCCGPFGNVGWVGGWKTDEMHPKRVVYVDLTLCHRSAHQFGQSEDDVREFSLVWKHVNDYSLTYGYPAVFTEEEPEEAGMRMEGEEGPQT